MNEMSEKEMIERATANAFIQLYNQKKEANFEIVKYSDAPDIRCKDKDGNSFNFEITLTEDKGRDIQAALGRSEHRSIDALKKHLADVTANKASIFDSVSCLQGDVLEAVSSRIKAKFKKDYGKNVALVVRDVSPNCWSWESVTGKLANELISMKNPFDMGVWIISCGMDKIYQVL